jgi:hypothetical protein
MDREKRWRQRPPIYLCDDVNSWSVVLKKHLMRKSLFFVFFYSFTIHDDEMMRGKKILVKQLLTMLYPFYAIFMEILQVEWNNNFSLPSFSFVVASSQTRKFLSYRTNCYHFLIFTCYFKHHQLYTSSFLYFCITKQVFCLAKKVIKQRH